MRWTFPVLLVLAFTGGGLQAQERVCDYSTQGRTERTERAGTVLIDILDPFQVRCTDGTVLRANSGVVDEVAQEVVLNGEVDFRDPDRTLTSNHATYNSVTGRLYATGDVVFTNRLEGSTLTGPELEYYPETEYRPEARVLARQRPHLSLQPRERDDDSEPLEIDADQLMIFGQDRLDATGAVVVTRSDLRATAEEAEYDGEAERLELRRDANIRTEEHDLSGDVIQARMAGGLLEHVHARRDVRLTSDELTITAPDLQLFFAEELLQRAVARTPPSEREADGGARAIALASAFRLEADSIDASIPGQRLDRVVAIGRARGESIDTVTGDADRPEIAARGESPQSPEGSEAERTPDLELEPIGTLAAGSPADRDWISGDTVTGYFAPPDSAHLVEGDTAVVLERIVASGSAMSVYRVESRESSAGARRGINFLSGDLIELTFAAGELELAEVTGLQKGLYLDPAPASAGSARSARREGG